MKHHSHRLGSCYSLSQISLDEIYLFFSLQSFPLSRESSHRFFFVCLISLLSANIIKSSVQVQRDWGFAPTSERIGIVSVYLCLVTCENSIRTICFNYLALFFFYLYSYKESGNIASLFGKDAEKKVTATTALNPSWLISQFMLFCCEKKTLYHD